MQDFLPIFAAGNYGTRLVDGTIASPSTSKNCISVGALLDAHVYHFALENAASPSPATGPKLVLCLQAVLRPTGASLTSLYRDSTSFQIYQPTLNLNSVIYTATITGGLKARVYVNR